MFSRHLRVPSGRRFASIHFSPQSFGPAFQPATSAPELRLSPSHARDRLLIEAFAFL